MRFDPNKAYEAAPTSGSSGFDAGKPYQPAPAAAPSQPDMLGRFGRYALAPVQGIANIPKDIGAAFKGGTDEGVAGEKQFAQGLDRGDIRDVAKGGAKTLLGGMRQLGSPVSGVAKAVLGDPIRDNIPGRVGQLLGDTAELAGGMFGPSEAPAIAKAVGKVAEKMAPRLIKSEAAPMAMEARKAGYVLPPAMASEKPGALSNVLAGWSGKIKTQQAASAKNQQVTNGLAAKALGLPEGITLTEPVFDAVRKQAGLAYQVVKDAIPSVKPDDKFAEEIAELGGDNSQAAKHFPGITKNPGVLALAKELKAAKPEIPTEAWVEIVKKLRFDGNANLKAMGDPAKHALGLAQREGANAIDSLIERNIAEAAKTDSSKKGIVEAYKNARQLIAKTYDVEGATNTTTGDVSARGLGRLADRGKPLTDELKTISDTANAFPKAMQNEAAFGGNEPLSALDFFGSAGAMMHGNPGIAGAILGRPVARSVLLSEPYQNRMIQPGAAGSSGAREAATKLQEDKIRAVAQSLAKGQTAAQPAPTPPGQVPPTP